MVNIHYLLLLRDINEGYLLLENCNQKQSNFAIELKNFEKGTKTLEKKSFLNNLGLLFSTREQVLNNFKSRLFPKIDLDKIPTPELATEPEVAKEPIKATKVTKAKTEPKISLLKLREKILNEVKNEEKI